LGVIGKSPRPLTWPGGKGETSAIASGVLFRERGYTARVGPKGSVLLLPEREDSDRQLIAKVDPEPAATGPGMLFSALLLRGIGSPKKEVASFSHDFKNALLS